LVLALSRFLLAFLLSGQRPLRQPELLLRAAQETRGADLAAVGEHRKVGESEIDADLRFGLRK
jgi:hypothetical protein